MKHAFTLVEILIVVVIIGILAAIVIPQFTAAADEAAKAKAEATALPTTQPAPSVAACGCEDCPIHGDRH